MRRFCPKCGKTINNGTFCEECTPSTLNYKMPLIQVSEYNRTWHKGTWHLFDDLEELIKSRVKEELKKKIDIVVEPFEFEFKLKEKIDVICEVILDGEKIKLPVQVSYRKCDMSQKEKTKYFEGILQLRNIKEDDEVMEYIHREVKKVGSKGIFITKVEEVGKDGVDLYLTNKNYIKLLAQNLNVKFGAKLSINSQLFSHNHLTSKDVFRINVLVTFLKFRPGNVIYFKYDGSRRTSQKEYFVLIKKLGKLVQAIDITNSKTVSFEAKYLEDVEILEEYKTKVISLEPKIQILNPKTYQCEEIVNSVVKGLEDDDEVLVVLTKIGNFIVGYPSEECL